MTSENRPSGERAASFETPTTGGSRGRGSGRAKPQGLAEKRTDEMRRRSDFWEGVSAGQACHDYTLPMTTVLYCRQTRTCGHMIAPSRGPPAQGCQVRQFSSVHHLNTCRAVHRTTMADRCVLRRRAGERRRRHRL